MATTPLSAAPAALSTDSPATPPETADALTIGRRIRHLRRERGLTLDHLAAALDRAPSQVSMIETGKREPRFAQLETIAQALGVDVASLLEPGAPTRRAELEIELERLQRGPALAAVGAAPVRVGPSLPMDALEAIVALHREIARLHSERAATPEEARRANAELRAMMRAQDNHFPELEGRARELLDGVGHVRGPLSARVAAELAGHLGFTLHYVNDLPHSTRSLIDTRHMRVYLPTRSSDPRSVLLQALSSHVLGHTEPRSYAEFLRQRVEANYLSAALLVPEADAVRQLREAKDAHSISVDDLRDAFGVSHETAAHRFTNLATVHLGIPVHFMKVHESGIVHKAYENDGVRFPSDALGAIEGQPVCRFWTARTVFEVSDRLSPFSQYTDTPAGTFWCTSRTQESHDGAFSVSVGVPFSLVKWFRGRDTTSRTESRCPDPSCCRRPSGELAQHWEGHVWPSARPHASTLATLPVGAFPGVDQTEVLEFLERHAPHGAE